MVSLLSLMAIPSVCVLQGTGVAAERIALRALTGGVDVHSEQPPSGVPGHVAGVPVSSCPALVLRSNFPNQPAPGDQPTTPSTSKDNNNNDTEVGLKRVFSRGKVMVNICSCNPPMIIIPGYNLDY